MMNALRFGVALLIVVLGTASASRAEEIGWHARGAGGAVASGGAEATAIGLEILRQGGNAADGAAATLLALSVTDYGFFCLGAEASLILYDAKTGQTKVLCGLGRAPLNRKAMDFYAREGIKNGTLPAAAVPGALSMIFKLLQDYGTLSFEQVATPTIDLLEKDTQHPEIKNLPKTLRKMIERERETQGTREQKIRAARDRFYKGDIADALARYYADNGGFLTKRDLAEYETRVEEPVTFDYRGYTVCKCDAWTQGPFMLQTLALLSHVDLKQMGLLSADAMHACVEAMKLAFADRDKFYADPLFVHVPLDVLLSPQYNALRFALIDPARASLEIRPGDPLHMRALSTPYEYEPWPGGTTTCCIADREGNMIAATPSGNPPYIVCEELGVAHANRLTSLNTNPRHPNRIEPGKRPRITLTPTLVLKDGKPILAISVAGGDVQDQTSLNLFLDFVDFGLMPEQAVRAPRFQTTFHEDGFGSNPNRKATLLGPVLTIDQGVEPKVLDELTKRGHLIGKPIKPIGMPVMLVRDPATGMLNAAGDPLAGRHAAALP